MEPKLIQKTRLGEYTWAEFSGTNESGMYPYGDRVLVLPDQAAKTSSGMIQFTDDQVDRNAYAAETGIIVAMGPEAFLWNSDRTRKWESGDKPKIGDHVVFDVYAGSYQHGRDGQMYRLMDDKCIGALAMDEVREAAVKGEPAAETVAVKISLLPEASPTNAPDAEAAKAPTPPAAPVKPKSSLDSASSDVNVLSLSYVVSRAIEESPTAAKTLRANPSLMGTFVDVVWDKAKGFTRDSIEREIQAQLAGLKAGE